MKKLNELQSYLTRLRGLMLTLIILCSIGSGNVWGASTTGYFKKVTSATLSAGDTVIIVNTAESKALQNISTTSTKYGTLTDVSATSNVVTLSGANVEMFVLETGYNSSGFSFKGTSNISNNYLYWTSGNSLNKNSTKSAKTSWTITWSSSTATIKNNSDNTRLIRFNSDRFACYTSSTGTLAQVYKKAYKVTYNGNGSTGGSVPTDANYYYKNASVTAKSNSGTLVRTGYTFNGWNTKADGSGTAVAATGSATFTLTYNTTLYAQWVSSGCSNKVNITAGTPESGGAFTLDKTGNQDCCSALTVTVSSITAPSGKRFSAITQSGIASGVTIDNNAKTVTYAANSSGASTINVTFEAIPTHDIHFNTGGLVAIADATGIQEGDTYNITETPAASLSEGCEYKTFVGWTTASSIADASIKPSIVTNVTMSTSDVTLYAVYSKTEGSGGGDKYTKVTATGDIEDGQYLIVNETASRAFNGGLATGSIDANSNYISVTITSSEIDVTSTTEAAEFTIDATNGYIQAADGFYIGSTNNANELLRNATNGYAHTLSIDADEDFVAATTYTTLRYNKASGTERFRYYKSGQESIQLYKKSSGTTTYSLNPSCDGPTITVSKTSIDFGDVKVGGSYTETFTVSGENLTGAINLAVSGAQAGRYSVSPTTLSPTAGTVAEITITVTFAPTASSDHAAQVDITSDGATAKTVSLHAISKWEVTWKNDGAVYETTFVQGGHKPDFPATPTSCDGVESNVFYGWTDAEWPGKIDDVSAKTIHKSNATMPNASNNTTIYYAVFVKRTGSVDEYTDDLTRATTGISSGSSYGAWSGKSASNTGHSSAVYAGQSAGGNDAIQLRATSPSGIITTTSGGKAKKVTVVWNSNTADGRTLDIYGKNAAYEAASDLYDNAKQGTKIGSIVYGTSTELTITDDYEYIGIRSNNNALYLDKISIDWQDGEYSYSKYMTNCCDKNVTLAHNSPSNGTVVFSPAGPVATCSGAQNVTMTITPAAGYKLTEFSASGVSASGGSPVTSGDASKSAQNIALTFAQDASGTYTASATFTAMTDHYKDQLHNTTNYTGDGKAFNATYTVPTLASTTPDSGCEGEHYKFVGWVEDTYVKSDGTLNSGYTLITGGSAGTASEKTYVAIWAKEL